ncbi:LysR family transcriptional regulator [Dyadobacter luteus]|jgi:DNA-binding transcriptional LysR family regulator|uniref:LysR family transcriptional regulator n=1 Tax=Dyadobacter luteus TaxID=2259619 RepID=A0A3D8Y3M6_9BACT|nr:LysR substrate-binding domain-containing protein [Dyadobacter luteus]REA55237.1 LysR family transcriptional regulator [Dyadobacter luteus]
MADFRLRVFYTVAQTLNFNRASEQLHISQPAVTKHIKELEQHYAITLFDRGRKQIKLTRAGEVLLQHAHLIFEQYQKLEFDINLLQNKTEGVLQIGASTTIAQYVIPQYLAYFHNRFPEIHIELTNANSLDIEQLLIRKKIDLGLVEGPVRHTDLKYTTFLQDEIVLVTGAKKSNKKRVITAKELSTLPILIRESGSGTAEIIDNHLSALGLSYNELNIQMQLGSTESIKNYLVFSDTFAFLSIYSIRQELADDRLTIVDVEGLDIQRMFSFVYRQGQPSPLAKLFMKFASLERK